MHKRYALMVFLASCCTANVTAGDLLTPGKMAAFAVGFLAARIPQGYIAFPLVALGSGGIGAYGGFPLAQYRTAGERLIQGSMTAYAACLGYAVGRALYYRYLELYTGYDDNDQSVIVRQPGHAVLTDEQQQYRMQHKYCKQRDALWRFTRRPAERWDQLASVGILLPPALAIVMTLSRHQ